MKVLVTGAAGFIGQHVVRALKEAGHYVIGLDMRESDVHVADESLLWDISMPLEPIPGLEGVVHLAAVSHPRECDTNPAKAFNFNVNGTHQVLKMSLESGVRKVVFASSAHVYGISPRYLPTNEGHPLWLQNTYTLTKILGEELCRLYYENHGLSYMVLRLFNAYGPEQRTGYFIPDMVSKAKAGRIDLPGGNTTKDWVYVTDVADAFVRAIDSDFVGAINIGTGKETELSTIAQFIAHEMGVGFSSTVDRKATRMCADNTRALRVLGWKPTKNIKEGLDAILNLAAV